MEKTLGMRIGELRRARGLTQEEVAEKLGVSSQAVSKWENDQSCPDIMSLPALAGLLGTTVDALLSGEKAPEVRYVPEERRDLDGMMLRIRINDSGERMCVNIPVALLKAMLDGGASPGSFIGGEGMPDVDFGKILSLVESGAVGKLIEVTQENETVVEIVVE
ncbi:MAG: helix-turn-helix domain-containing protein [Candidatus Enterenecus sp.]